MAFCYALFQEVKKKMPQQYELKQVRVYLKEATPLYSNQEITSPESAIRIMSEALVGMDRVKGDH